jgi:hypothetical protein
MSHAESTRHFLSSTSRLRRSQVFICTFPFSAVSNRHFIVRFKTAVTHTKQTPASRSNRNISDPLPPNCRVEFIPQS